MKFSLAPMAASYQSLSWFIVKDKRKWATHAIMTVFLTCKLPVWSWISTPHQFASQLDSFYVLVVVFSQKFFFKSFDPIGSSPVQLIRHSLTRDGHWKGAYHPERDSYSLLNHQLKYPWFQWYDVFTPDSYLVTIVHHAVLFDKESWAFHLGQWGIFGMIQCLV